MSLTFCIFLIDGRLWAFHFLASLVIVLSAPLLLSEPSTALTSLRRALVALLICAALVARAPLRLRTRLREGWAHRAGGLI